jgi:hypothetical protein
MEEENHFDFKKNPDFDNKKFSKSMLPKIPTFRPASNVHIFDGF